MRFLGLAAKFGSKRRIRVKIHKTKVHWVTRKDGSGKRDDKPRPLPTTAILLKRKLSNKLRPKPSCSKQALNIKIEDL